MAAARASAPQTEAGTSVDVAGIITAVGGAIAIIIKVTGMPAKRRRVDSIAARLEHLERRQAVAESKLLGWAAWAHDARVTAAANGVRLPVIPSRLLLGDDASVPAPRDGSDAADRTDV